MENTKKMNLTTKIFIALILGVVTGLILHPIKENPMVEKYLLNKVQGDIITKTLSIEEGAIFEGNSTMKRENIKIEKK